jgi:OMF family outer membrane factor
VNLTALTLFCVCGGQAKAQPQQPSQEPIANPPAGPGVLPRQVLPLAPQVKGNRPKSNPAVLPPAATTLPPEIKDLRAPESLALPVKPSQVQIRELRPLGLDEVETLVEVNNPSLKALASQVDQAQSALRAQIALWYPNINLNAGRFPTYSAGEQAIVGTDFQGQPLVPTRNSIWRMQAALEASWSLIDPTRTPQIAAARDQFEQAKNEYLIGLRDLRLQASQLYFDLQSADEQVRIGQESVRSSLISLRDARARFRAGVATKLEVLEAETQLARDQQLLTAAFAQQSTARRDLAAVLDLPQNVTPTAKDPSRVIGSWLPSLQESIVAAYAFREELDQILLNISVANSNANAELGQAQPFLQILYSFGFGRSYGYEGVPVNQPALDQEGWNVDNTIGMNLSWNLFDGGRARALYRRQKQVAQENRYRFAERRDAIRQEVEFSFFELEKNLRNITTTSREVISTRESLRLARLRFQAGVTTQREVVDTQRDTTQAEVRYANAITDYNKRLAELRRRTGLDQIALCSRPNLPASKPLVEGASEVPVEPQILVPACGIEARPADGRRPFGS